MPNQIYSKLRLSLHYSIHRIRVSASAWYYRYWNWRSNRQCQSSSLQVHSSLWFCTSAQAEVCSFLRKFGTKSSTFSSLPSCLRNSLVALYCLNSRFLRILAESQSIPLLLCAFTWSTSGISKLCLASSENRICLKSLNCFYFLQKCHELCYHQWMVSPYSGFTCYCHWLLHFYSVFLLLNR